MQRILSKTTTAERLIAAGATVVLILAVVFAATGGSDDDEGAALVVGSPTPAAATTKPGAKATAKPATPARPGTAPAPAATAAAPAATSAAVQPGATVPPKAGLYRYKETTDGESSTSTLRVTDQGSGKQTEAYEEGLENAVEWRGDGKYVTETTFGEPPQGFECDWDPDFRELSLPLAQGKTWKADSSCEGEQGVQIRFQASSQVTGAKRITAAGQQVDTWVMALKGTLTFKTPQGSFDQKVEATEYFSPPHGLSVLSNETSEGRDPTTGDPEKRTTRRELQNLTPE